MTLSRTLILIVALAGAGWVTRRLLARVNGTVVRDVRNAR